MIPAAAICPVTRDAPADLVEVAEAVPLAPVFVPEEPEAVLGVDPEVVAPLEPVGVEPEVTAAVAAEKEVVVVSQVIPGGAFWMLKGADCTILPVLSVSVRPIC